MFGRVWTRILNFLHIDDRLTDSSTITVHNRESVFKNSDVATVVGGGCRMFFFLHYKIDNTSLYRTRFESNAHKQRQQLEKLIH